MGSVVSVIDTLSSMVDFDSLSLFFFDREDHITKASCYLAEDETSFQITWIADIIPSFCDGMIIDLIHFTNVTCHWNGVAVAGDMYMELLCFFTKIFIRIKIKDY